MDAQLAQVITTVSTVAGTVLVAWIAYKTTILNRKVDEVKKQTDGITSALVQSTAKASHAEGKAEGVAEERATEATDNTAAPPR